MSGLHLHSAQAALLLGHVIRCLLSVHLQAVLVTCWIVQRLRWPGVRDFCKNWGVSNTVSETFCVSSPSTNSRTPVICAKYRAHGARLSVKQLVGISSGIRMGMADKRMQKFVHNAMPASGNGVDFRLSAQLLRKR